MTTQQPIHRTVDIEFESFIEANRAVVYRFLGVDHMIELGKEVLYADHPLYHRQLLDKPYSVKYIGKYLRGTDYALVFLNRQFRVVYECVIGDTPFSKKS